MMSKPLNTWIKIALVAFAAFVLSLAVTLFSIDLSSQIYKTLGGQVSGLLIATCLFGLPILTLVAAGIGWYKVDRKMQRGRVLAPTLIILMCLWFVAFFASTFPPTN